VVDRALVKAKIIEKNLSQSIMTVDAIRDLTSALKIDFLILGKISRLDAGKLDF
jgi:hypothetical protein